MLSRRTTEERQYILKAFATGSTIETISATVGESVDTITKFLEECADEIVALKDFYSKVRTPMQEEIMEIQEKAVNESDPNHERY